MIRFKDVPPSDKPKAAPPPVREATVTAEAPPAPSPAPAKRGRPRKDAKPA